MYVIMMLCELHGVKSGVFPKIEDINDLKLQQVRNILNTETSRWADESMYKVF